MCYKERKIRLIMTALILPLWTDTSCKTGLYYAGRFFPHGSMGAVSEASSARAVPVDTSLGRCLPGKVSERHTQGPRLSFKELLRGGNAQGHDCILRAKYFNWLSRIKSVYRFCLSRLSIRSLFFLPLPFFS